MREALLLGIVLLLLISVSSVAADGLDSSGWDELLRAHVAEGHVDYEGMMGDRAGLRGYLAGVATADTSGWTRSEQMAFWINAYNALMVEAVLDHWPLESVLDIGRFLGIPTLAVFREKHPVAGTELSLDDIEHRILRERFRDPRIHAALVCASISCPILASRAYRAERLDAQLDSAMRGFLEDPGRNRPTSRPPRLSRIFRWYGDDFRAASGTVWAYVRENLSPEVRSVLPPSAEVEFLPYDWGLNR
jgi:hypothetical protein